MDNSNKNDGEIILEPDTDGKNKKSTTTSDLRQAKQKELVLEQLKKTPIIQMVCEKLNIGRTTFYRWKREDLEFSKACDEAIEDGCLLVNDLAESQLMAAIRDQNMTAIVLWLKTHHPKYRNKMEVTANIKHLDEALTPEQQAVVEQALRLASLIESDVQEPVKEQNNGQQPKQLPAHGAESGSEQQPAGDGQQSATEPKSATTADNRAAGILSTAQ